MIFHLKRDMLDSQLYPWNIKVIAREYRVMRKLLKTRGAHSVDSSICYVVVTTLFIQLILNQSIVYSYIYKRKYIFKTFSV